MSFILNVSRRMRQIYISVRATKEHCVLITDLLDTTLLDDTLKKRQSQNWHLKLYTLALLTLEDGGAGRGYNNIYWVVPIG